MARPTLTDVINQINNVIVQNTSGNITAPALNNLLQYLTNATYLDNLAQFNAQAEGVELGPASAINVQNLQFDYDAVNDVFTIIGPTLPNSINLVDVTAVNQKSDFPAPVSGVITLEPDTTYLIGQSFDLGTDRLLFSNNSAILSLSRLGTVLSYQGTDPMLTVGDVDMQVKGITLDAPNAPLFASTQTQADHQLRVEDVTMSGVSLGSFVGFDTGARFSNTTSNFTGAGATITGTWKSWFYDVATLNTAGDSFDTTGATFFSFRIERIIATVSDAASHLIAGDPTITSGGVGSAVSCRVIGATNALEFPLVDSPDWEFLHNNVIPDTNPRALLRFNGNATETTITTIDTPVKVNATWVESRTSQFDFDTSGRATYQGNKQLPADITCSVSVSPASGNDVGVALYIAVNGSVVSESVVTLTADANDPINATLVWQEDLSTDDYVEVWIANTTGTTNLIVSDAVMRIR